MTMSIVFCEIPAVILFLLLAHHSMPKGLAENQRVINML
ncbi:hypothetical protein CyaNS01_02023 [Cyanobium sp. NS01]|nr:hypothetical protein CyaNS01_02023 [Cyanobium sp. NS01]